MSKHFPRIIRLGSRGRLTFALAGLTLLAVGAVPAAPAEFAPYTVELVQGLAKFEMVPVPGGVYTFTDPVDNQTREVTIKPFWMGKYEVTWDAYDIFTFRMDLSEEEVVKNVDATNRPSMPYGAPDRGYGHQGYPAISIALKGAQMYCEWLSRVTGHKYRLATEAEWEWAARGGPAARTDDNLDEVAWHWGNSEDKTHPCGAKAANPLGLHDLLGNAAEWVICSDGSAVVKGGSFLDEQELVKPTSREAYDISWQQQDPQDPKSKWWLSDGGFVGFRIVRSFEDR